MANSFRTVFVFNLCALSIVQCDQFSRNTYNVFDFGAAADGSTDDTQIDGELIAPRDPSKWKCKGNKCHQWIGFVNLNGLYISGSGTINAQGTQWWASFCNHKKQGCGRKKPTGFAISYSKDVHISDLTFMDSPQMHISFERSKWVYATNLTITAPQHSPNTDGIHTQHSQYVFIAETHIATGEKMKNETVEHVYVSDVDFRGTSNGARIKTWQTSAVQVSNVRYSQIYGTSREDTAVKFACSESVPCKDIFMNDVNIQSADQHISKTTSFCQNVQGWQNGEVSPGVPCLRN
ncbi:probable polygalacturonase At3g15720 [Actinidia eriantha]|uniref:probable polygalacturonase At3g15720 n=1 Tax=Actinidia eriantha TaxID=165200 RepID=UPI0025892CE5|nr:probable polygalacturonase At3g15720 [Actinidia eriantha]